MSEKQQFENKQVYLWGVKQAKQKYLDIYDKGDQHPNRRAKKAVNENQPREAPKVREFEIGEDYGVSDLVFLNKEYDRIDKILSKLLIKNFINDEFRMYIKSVKNDKSF